MGMGLQSYIYRSSNLRKFWYGSTFLSLFVVRMWDRKFQLAVADADAAPAYVGKQVNNGQAY